MQTQNIQNLIRDLREDNTSGANEFIDKALEIIRLQFCLTENAAEDIKEEFMILSKQLIDSRPSMAPLINTIGYLIQDSEILNKNILEERLNQFPVDRAQREKTLESFFLEFLGEKKKIPLKIMLISYSSTIINLLLKNKELNFEIFVLESRPLFEGQRVAEILSQYFRTHLIIDAAIGTFIDEVDLVLIGVDSILIDGSVINKIGTFPLAVLAKTKKINVYAVCDSFKYNLKSHYGYRILITEKPLKEVYNKEITHNLLEIHNYYFDITPSKYISRIISDLGILSSEAFLEMVKNTLPIEWFKYFINKKRV